VAATVTKVMGYDICTVQGGKNSEFLKRSVTQHVSNNTYVINNNNTQEAALAILPLTTRPE